VELDLIHLERLSLILNSPPCYGIRLEFLDIEMTKEEQLAFLAARDVALAGLQADVKEVVNRLRQKEEDADTASKVVTAAPVHYVTPRYSNSPFAMSLFGDRHYTCSCCGFGYYIIVPSSARLDTMYTTSLGIGEKTITCPKCGNVEKYHG